MASVPPVLLALFALLVVGGVIHVVFLLVYRRGDLSGRDASADPPADEPIERLFATRNDGGDRDDDRERGDSAFDPSTTVRCPKCRTINDAAYSYCRECAAPLHE